MSLHNNLVTFVMQMRIISFILVTYISLLTVQPVGAQIYSSLFHKSEKVCTHECCKKKSGSPSKKEKGNCCDKGVCNPFGMCNCCFVFNSDTSSITFKVPFIKNKISSSSENNPVSSFISDCFHPPEIA